MDPAVIPPADQYQPPNPQRGLLPDEQGDFESITAPSHQRNESNRRKLLADGKGVCEVCKKKLTVLKLDFKGTIECAKCHIKCNDHTTRFQSCHTEQCKHDECIDRKSCGERLKKRLLRIKTGEICPAGHPLSKREFYPTGPADIVCHLCKERDLTQEEVQSCTECDEDICRTCIMHNITTCEKGHELKTIPDALTCDLCEKDDLTKEQVQSCTECDYDICHNCVTANGGAPPSQPSEPQQPPSVGSREAEAAKEAKEASERAEKEGKDDQTSGAKMVNVLMVGFLVFGLFLQM